MITLNVGEIKLFDKSSFARRRIFLSRDMSVYNFYAPYIIDTEDKNMNKLLIGMTLGAIAGVVAFKKMEDKRIPEKVLDSAKEKLCDN